MDLHKLHPSPIPSIKVLRSFFKSDRSPRSPVSPFPKLLVVAQREEMPKQIAKGEAEGAESHPAEPFFVTDAGCNGGIAVFGAVGVAAIEVDAFGIGACGGAAIGRELRNSFSYSNLQYSSERWIACRWQARDGFPRGKATDQRLDGSDSVAMVRNLP